MEFVFLPLEWILNLEAALHSLQHLVVIVLRSQKMHNFKLQFSHVGGCGGQPIRSKSILKVKTQIPIPKEHAQITFLNPIDCFLSEIPV